MHILKHVFRILTKPRYTNQLFRKNMKQLASRKLRSTYTHWIDVIIHSHSIINASFVRITSVHQQHNAILIMPWTEGRHDLHLSHISSVEHITFAVNAYVCRRITYCFIKIYWFINSSTKEQSLDKLRCLFFTHKFYLHSVHRSNFHCAEGTTIFIVRMRCSQDQSLNVEYSILGTATIHSSFKSFGKSQQTELTFKY